MFSRQGVKVLAITPTRGVPIVRCAIARSSTRRFTRDATRGVDRAPNDREAWVLVIVYILTISNDQLTTFDGRSRFFGVRSVGSPPFNSFISALYWPRRCTRMSWARFGSRSP